MSSTADAVDVPPEAAKVARRYRRVERPVTAAVAALVVVLFVVSYLQMPLLQAAVVGVVLVALVRTPVVRSRGTVRLESVDDPEAVREEFGGSTPPILALQWGVADEVRRTDDGAVYDVTYLFGLRSTTMEAEVRPIDARASVVDGAAADLEIVVTGNGRPWATYDVTIDGREAGTVVDIEFESDRRFGLRRVPQWLVAECYREAAIEAQGYSIVQRNVGLSV